MLFLGYMRLAFVAIPVALTVAAIACSSTLHVEDYDTACTTNDDCVTEFLGDICECSCDGIGAISKKGKEKYDQDRGSITCSNQCEPCANRDVAVCNAGTCKAQRCAGGGSVKFCAPTCGGTTTVTACECPAGTVDKLTCSLDAGPG